MSRDARNVREERRWAAYDDAEDTYRVFPKNRTREHSIELVLFWERLVRVTILVPTKEKK